VAGARPGRRPDLQRHDALLTDFELSDRLPRHERAVRWATAELAAHFTPDVVPGHRYDLATIVVLVPTGAGLPPMGPDPGSWTR
jgi:hypothetical protein